MSLKDVELTGVVTLFYGEFCSELDIIPSKDPIRKKIYNHYKAKFEQEKTDVHHLLSMDKINFQGILNVAYRNYKFDEVVQEIISSNHPSEVVNLGCGMDTRFFRLSEFTGDYFDVDFKDVIREKKRIIGETENYHFIETKSIVEKSFWEDELVITSDNPLIIVEGVFCYIEYPKVVHFVKELFKRYPKATLVCDVFLFDKHQCFDDLKSKINLKYPVKGEQIYKILSKLPFMKKKKKQVEVDGKEQLKGIDLIKCDSSQENNHSINYNGKSYSPQYWIGVYRISFMKSKALVWGSGKSAYTVANYLKAEFADSIDFVGFYVSDHQHINNAGDEPIYAIGEVVSNSNVIADILIIPNPGKKISDILFEHRKVESKKILFVSAENIRRPDKNNYFVEINGNKPWLNGFEYHVVDHCNLNCKGCGHCANLFNSPSHGDLNVYERDLKRLSELFEGVGLIRLLGGEPLLSSNLERYIEITREYFKHAEIHIVTNGILIPSIRTEFLLFLKENGVIVDISVYPPVENKVPQIIETLKRSCVEHNVMPVEQFYKRFSLDGKFDKVEAFKNCGTATCHTLYDGKIAPCIVPFSTDKLNREFNINISIDGWIDLFEEGIDGDAINERLKQPFELCSHCNPEKFFFDWEQRRFEDCKLDDWICE